MGNPARAVSNTEELTFMGISREAMRSLVVACWESDAEPSRQHPCALSTLCPTLVSSLCQRSSTGRAADL